MFGEEGIMGRCVCVCVCVCVTVGGGVCQALSLKGHCALYTSYRSRRTLVGVQMPQHSEPLRG